MLEFQRCTKPRRTSLSDGLPPFTVFDHFDSDSESASIISKLPPNLRFLRQIHVIQKEAFKTLVRNFLKPQTANECSALHSLIEMFDSRVLEHRSECSSELDEFTLECARLNIRTFHFFAKADLAEPLGFIELYTLARSVLDHATLLDTTQDFSLYCSQYSIRMTLLAAFVILKISRSHLAHRVDLRGGESSYFSAIHLSKKRSLQNGDLDSRCALILTQLWSSNSIFRRRDGTVDSLRMRTRCRLSVGVVFECFWWWRTEFDGKPNIYSEEGEPQSEDPTIPEAIYDPNLSDIDIYSTVFPDWQWAAGPNFLADFPDGIELGLDNIPAILT
ncbi:hypothetical protein DL98DRAFT_20917 [Cadophora sp. DSE1049]|nr:hypothetical protein DL98DRAFT_20917 [Cadophora sp. DSE1049]